MPIEKAFRIQATPEAVWEALWADIAAGDAKAFSLHSLNWPRLLSLKVDLSGVRAQITYRLTPAGDHTEVSATLEPLSRRYVLYQVLTLGHFRTNYEILLVEGLANLKAAVESSDVRARGLE